MMLLLDVGNSRLKWALAHGPELADLGAAAHDGRPAQALRTLPLPRPRVVWLAHVLGAAHEKRLHAAIRARFGIVPRIARTHRQWAGLRVAYAAPSRLGVDRFLAMLALWSATKKAFCVATAGTALTFDAVDRRGRHRGGLIAPGLTTAWNAVRGATRFELPPSPARYTRGLGTDTDGCVRQGTLYACAGLIERAAREAGGSRYLSGGDAPALRRHLDGRWTARPNLVLEGLLAYAREWSWLHA
jgi:type III pantothenate kinase